MLIEGIIQLGGSTPPYCWKACKTFLRLHWANYLTKCSDIYHLHSINMSFLFKQIKHWELILPTSIHPCLALLPVWFLVVFLLLPIQSIHVALNLVFFLLCTLDSRHAYHHKKPTPWCFKFVLVSVNSTIRFETRIGVYSYLQDQCDVFYVKTFWSALVFSFIYLIHSRLP